MDQITQILSDQINKIEPFSVICENYQEREPHPEGQGAYIFKGKFEWHRASHVKIFVEISRGETLCFSPVSRTIHHAYGEEFNSKVLTYSLEEIVLEKLRGILQHTQKIHERQWTRSRARDYYDLWRILTSYIKELKIENLFQSLKIKCDLKKVSFSSSASFFDESMIKFIKKTWNKWLGPLVQDLPPCELVLRDLQPLISQLIDIDDT